MIAAALSRRHHICARAASTGLPAQLEQTGDVRLGERAPQRPPALAGPRLGRESRAHARVGSSADRLFYLSSHRRPALLTGYQDDALSSLTRISGFRTSHVSHVRGIV